MTFSTSRVAALLVKELAELLRNRAAIVPVLFLALVTLQISALVGLLPTAEGRGLHVAGSAIALALLAGGLFASFFHLGRPERAWRSAAMWRTSWLAREVIVKVLHAHLARGLVDGRLLTKREAFLVEAECLLFLHAKIVAVDGERALQDHGFADGSGHAAVDEGRIGAQRRPIVGIS